MQRQQDSADQDQPGYSPNSRQSSSHSSKFNVNRREPLPTILDSPPQSPRRENKQVATRMNSRDGDRPGGFNTGSNTQKGEQRHGGINYSTASQVNSREEKQKPKSSDTPNTTYASTASQTTSREKTQQNRDSSTSSNSSTNTSSTSMTSPASSRNEKQHPRATNTSIAPKNSQKEEEFHAGQKGNLPSDAENTKDGKLNRADSNKGSRGSISALAPRGEQQSYTGVAGSNENSSSDPGNKKGVRPARERTGGKGSTFTDFFSPEVFHIVLRNPTTAYRLLKFSQSRACGEYIEFLHKIDAYHRLLDNVTQTLSTINTTYTAPGAPRQINISGPEVKKISTEIKQSTQQVLPKMQGIFNNAQDHVESIVATNIYPRFVKHQVTTSATWALSSNREKFQGLGDCFCITDPKIADNPITFASDGFITTTGYNRKDIIHKNCRFLQGEHTDPVSVKRLRKSIHGCEETVELILNYRKNGDPFWNLVYVSPLINTKGEVTLFLGGQINCSTTIHSFTDILKVLSVNDDELDEVDDDRPKFPLKPNAQENFAPPAKLQSSFFKSFIKYKPTLMRNLYTDGDERVVVREEAGMEKELLDRVGSLNFTIQVEAFYTAYSKYLVLSNDLHTGNIQIAHYSPGIIDMLHLHLPNGSTSSIFQKDIFKILAENSSSPSASKTFKTTVTTALRKGNAVSLEMGLLTGFSERKGSRFFKGGEGLKRVEEKYVSHWTPLKDDQSMVKWIVLIIAPKV